MLVGHSFYSACSYVEIVLSLMLSLFKLLLNNLFFLGWIVNLSASQLYLVSS